METEQFTVEAKASTSDKLVLRIVVTVKSTKSLMPIRIRKTKNVIFDMLRSQDFDADKIMIE